MSSDSDCGGNCSGTCESCEQGTTATSTIPIGAQSADPRVRSSVPGLSAASYAMTDRGFFASASPELFGRSASFDAPVRELLERAEKLVGSIGMQMAYAEAMQLFSTVSEEERKNPSFGATLATVFGSMPSATSIMANVEIMRSSLDPTYDECRLLECVGLPERPWYGLVACQNTGSCTIRGCGCKAVGSICICVVDGITGKFWFWVLVVALAALIIWLASTGVGIAIAAWIADLLAKVAAGLLTLQRALELIKEAKGGTLPGLT